MNSLQDIIREKSLAETLAERDQMIINLHVELEQIRKNKTDTQKTEEKK